MKNRIITLVVLLLSLVFGLHGTQNFLQKLSKEKLKKTTPAIIEKLIEGDSTLLNERGENQEVPLITAILLKRFELACKLIELNAEAKVQVQNQETPLDLMVDHLLTSNLDSSCKMLVQLLLQKEVQVTQAGVTKIVKNNKELGEETKEVIAAIIKKITDKNLINAQVEFLGEKSGSSTSKNTMKKSNRKISKKI